MKDDNRSVDEILSEWDENAPQRPQDARRDTISVQEVVDTLNQLLVADKPTIQSLFDHRVGCNETIANHPSVIVGLAKNWRKNRPDIPIAEDARYVLGPLGILNGLFGMNEERTGPIGGIYQDVCDTCHEELDRPDENKIRIGDRCPRCNEGTVVVGPLVGFRNLWDKGDQEG